MPHERSILCGKCNYTVTSAAALACNAFNCPARSHFRQQFQHENTKPMKLTDLEPRWIHDSVFVFRCPHCRKTWLSCKFVTMSTGDQIDLFRSADLDPCGPRYAVVPMNPDFAWTLKDGNRDFATMTVTPSINAEASGHWHGHITAGAIIGGI